jgi:hypothetical protein
MGKYADLQASAFSVFNSTEWKAESIKTYPDNFVPVNPGDEFVRVSMIPSGRGINSKSTSGVFQIDIFTPAGKGPERAMLLADKLDLYLQQQSKAISEGTLQFLLSSLYLTGVDKANSALYRAKYTIPFNFFGVL